MSANSFQVNFEVTGSHPSVSPLMKEILEKNKFTCELEVVAMPHSLRCVRKCSYRYIMFVVGKALR